MLYPIDPLLPAYSLHLIFSKNLKTDITNLSQDQTKHIDEHLNKHLINHLVQYKDTIYYAYIGSDYEHIVNSVELDGTAVWDEFTLDQLAYFNR